MESKGINKIKVARIFLYCCLVISTFLDVYHVISYAILIDAIIIMLLFVLEKFPKT